jgi:uncharacterized protein YqeY
MSTKRTEISESLKTAMKAKDEALVLTLRSINAKIKDADIEARPKGMVDGIDDSAILALLQNMIKQRAESAKIFTEGNRPELASKELAEIKIIETFLPAQLTIEQISEVVGSVITKVGATSVKDMGKIMAELKANYAGQMDMSKVGDIVKARFA